MIAKLVSLYCSSINYHILSRASTAFFVIFYAEYPFLFTYLCTLHMFFLLYAFRVSKLSGNDFRTLSGNFVAKIIFLKTFASILSKSLEDTLALCDIYCYNVFRKNSLYWHFSQNYLQELWIYRE